MFVFVIPRTPLKYRSPLRNELWSLSKKALISQTSQNWKAIIIGDTSGDKLPGDKFYTIPGDDYNKIEKLEMSLKFIESWPIKPDYLIRLDDDDIISPVILSFIAQLPKKYACYYDSRHACIDLVYLKISFGKNLWFANTVIHKYEHAIEKCGKHNQKILLQHHDEYWHKYYSDKNTYAIPKDKAIYYRILSPFSITSALSSTDTTVKWSEHLTYLNGYGPWVPLADRFYYYEELKKISQTFFKIKPLRNIFYWILNHIKFLNNRLLNR